MIFQGAVKMEVAKKLITNQYMVKIKINSVILAFFFCVEEMVPYYYFSHTPIPPFTGIIHSAKTVYSETLYKENSISINLHAESWVHVD